MFRTSNIRSLVLASVIVTTSAQAGCMALMPKSGVSQQQLLDSVQTSMFVVGSDAWLCPTAAAALAKTECEGGRQVLHNRSVMVRGQAAKAGVWAVPDITSPTPRDLYIAADQLSALPVLTAFDAFDADVVERYPAAKRIANDKINFVDILIHPQKYAGKYLVVRQNLKSIHSKQWAEGAFSFNLSIPVYAGATYGTDARFEFRNADIVNEFNKGQRSYQCAEFCDEFILVAEVTGKTVESAKSGRAIKVPVFNIVEMADRFGKYRAD